ncbi:hypothetical protein Tco_0658997 [Tanacetum coccineum]
MVAVQDRSIGRKGFKLRSRKTFGENICHLKIGWNKLRIQFARVMNKTLSYLSQRIDGTDLGGKMHVIHVEDDVIHTISAAATRVQATSPIASEIPDDRVVCRVPHESKTKCDGALTYRSILLTDEMRNSWGISEVMVGCVPDLNDGLKLYLGTPEKCPLGPPCYSGALTCVWPPLSILTLDNPIDHLADNNMVLGPEGLVGFWALHFAVKARELGDWGNWEESSVSSKV